MCFGPHFYDCTYSQHNPVTPTLEQENYIEAIVSLRRNEETRPRKTKIKSQNEHFNVYFILSFLTLPHFIL